MRSQPRVPCGCPIRPIRLSRQEEDQALIVSIEIRETLERLTVTERGAPSRGYRYREVGEFTG